MARFRSQTDCAHNEHSHLWSQWRRLLARIRAMSTLSMRGREAKKEDKRRRIRAAAAALFHSQGYEGTTTRAIAERAGIATGTLFLYVRDKDEALALVYGDDVDAVLAAQTKNRPSRLRFVAGLAHRFRGLYELYARHSDLALRFVRRIPTLEDAEKAAHDERNERMLAVIRDEVVRAMGTGELRSDLDVELAKRTLFAIVRVLVFGWLAAPPVAVDAGIRELEVTLRLLVSGLGARPEPPSPRSTARRPAPRRAR
ncbi:MAG: TetR/AcrR family transcriptional regulator [Labilithrix sp.]|nr:TetR/AcrR family transcriptional regulator [Labilithrix sp.]